MMRFYLIILFLFQMIACSSPPSPEDVQLMENIAREEILRTERFVSSMRAQLAFYGSPGDEAKYYYNSEELMEVRRTMLNNVLPESLVAYNDTLNNRYKILKESPVYSGTIEWSEADEQLRQHYHQKMTEDFDSLSYYQYLYTTLKKEYALHLSNAKMMAH